MLLLTEMLPLQNVWAAYALRRLLWLALLRAGVMSDIEPGAVGPLNDCVMAFIVTDAKAAIEILKTELGQLHILDYCQIGISDDGHQWEGVYPNPGTRMAWAMSMERQELFVQHFKEKMRRQVKLLGGAADEPKRREQGDSQ